MIIIKKCQTSPSPRGILKFVQTVPSSYACFNSLLFPASGWLHLVANFSDQSTSININQLHQLLTLLDPLGHWQLQGPHALHRTCKPPRDEPRSMARVAFRSHLESLARLCKAQRPSRSRHQCRQCHAPRPSRSRGSRGSPVRCHGDLQKAGPNGPRICDLPMISSGSAI